MIQDLKAQLKYIRENSSFNIIKSAIFKDNLIIYITAEDLVNFLHFLKNDETLSFKTLIDIFGADMLGKQAIRFEVIYNLLSYKLNNRITIKVAVEEDEKLFTIKKIFDNCSWYEREVFDMYGIKFIGNKDLRRILTDYEFKGHPLRKDFPLTGYEEVVYDENCRKVVYQPVKLEQEYRDFDFSMPWQGMLDKK
jgi:NADH-quinone oxidoreductase subunit C